MNTRPSLRNSLSTPTGKQRYVRRLFATIATRYDFITGFLSFGQDQRWKRRLIRLARLRPSDRVLDVACGTGDLTFAAAPQVASAIGLDVTYPMLQLARARSASLRGTDAVKPRLFVAGDMLQLPFSSGMFTVVTTGYGLRNVPDLNESVREIKRVLVPGGRLLSLDFNRPENAVIRSVYLSYLSIVGGALGFALHADPDTYRYIPESIRRYPGAAGVARILEQHGFIDVGIHSVLGGLMAIHVASVPASVREPAR